ncbi:UNVERIFIED_CONTAM: CubicO group peptidase (beta-lactamase class C family) [Acetivibrio alkalicellulosi]
MKLIKNTICFLCISIILAGVLMPSLKEKVNASPGFNIQEIDRYLQNFKDNSPIPGFSVVVVHGDEIIFTKGYGVESVDTGIPMTEHSSSAIGSYTKSFTALAIMQLVESGKISLDDPVIRYIPWFKTANEEESQKITIRMLLSNTSGLPSLDNWFFSVGIPGQADNNAMEKDVRNLSSYRTNRTPGTSFLYSNEGFNVAGVVIENVTGMKYADYIQKYILDPLEMSRSTTDHARFNDLGVLYGHNAGIDTATPSKPLVTTAALAAGSELRASANDLGHYFIALLNGGQYRGKQIISPESIDEMWTPHISFPGTSYDMGGDGSDSHYGLGWMISEIEGRTFIHHGGSTLTMSSFNAIYPEKKLAVSFLSNIGPTDSFRFIEKETVVNNIFNILTNKPTTDYFVPRKKDPSVTDYELPVDVKERYAGTYVSKDGFFKAEVFIAENGKLIARLSQITGISEFEIFFVNESRCFLKNIMGSYESRFLLTADGQVTGIENFFGTLSKINEDAHSMYKTVSSPDGLLSFNALENMIISFTENGFDIVIRDDADFKLSVNVLDESLENTHNVFNETITYDNIILMSEEFEDIINSRIWKEKSYITQQDGEKYQHFVATTYLKNKTITLILSVSYGQLTNMIRDAAIPIMKSLEVNLE